jgi:hypothetical protein
MHHWAALGPLDCYVAVMLQPGSNKTGPISIVNTFDISGIIRFYV